MCRCKQHIPFLSFRLIIVSSHCFYLLSDNSVFFNLQMSVGGFIFANLVLKWDICEFKTTNKLLQENLLRVIIIVIQLIVVV